jgi:hypothetical protein
MRAGHPNYFNVRNSPSAKNLLRFSPSGVATIAFVTKSARKAAAEATPTSGVKETTAGRPTARRELVENEMFKQASRLFAERGFAGTNLGDIAEAMGITRPALYYYAKLGRRRLLEGAVAVDPYEHPGRLRRRRRRQPHLDE